MKTLVDFNPTPEGMLCIGRTDKLLYRSSFKDNKNELYLDNNHIKTPRNLVKYSTGRKTSGAFFCHVPRFDTNSPDLCTINNKLNVIIMVFKDLFGKKCKVLGKTENSITFSVERFLPKPKQKLYFYNGDELERRLQSDESLDNIENRCITSSFRNETLGYVGSDVLYKCMVNAFADHRPLVLSPDMIWIVLCQAFSHHIKLNHKKYRSKIVRHNGFKTLKVITTSDLLSENADWESLFDNFFTKIDCNTKMGIASVIESNFSTSGINERIASQITLMNITKHFFKFEAFRIICGIPEITLEGTAEDWVKIMDKLNLFDQFGLNQWTKDLRPIISEFINTANGNPDAKFWRTMMKKSHLWPLIGPTCSYNSKPTKFDGWFLKLFPFDRGGEKTKDAYYQLTDMLPELVNVDMKYNMIDTSGKVIISHELKLFSGFVGVEENPETKALRPKIGWMVCKKESCQA